eukprot:3764179-Amphidinium_carterae.1
MPTPKKRKERPKVSRTKGSTKWNSRTTPQKQNQSLQWQGVGPETVPPAEMDRPNKWYSSIELCTNHGKE